MNDKELLELAAKAAGIGGYDALIIDIHGIWVEDNTPGAEDSYYWNPLTDDGDALRLAVKLKLPIEFRTYEVDCGSPKIDDVAVGTHETVWAAEEYTRDPYAATRRAIVRAAAEIGKGLK